MVSQPAAAGRWLSFQNQEPSGLRKATSEVLLDLPGGLLWSWGRRDGVCRATIKMPCSHVFHEDCLLQWLKEHSTCPICRMSLPTSEG